MSFIAAPYGLSFWLTNKSSYSFMSYEEIQDVSICNDELLLIRTNNSGNSGLYMTIIKEYNSAPIHVIRDNLKQFISSQIVKLQTMTQ